MQPAEPHCREKELSESGITVRLIGETGAADGPVSLGTAPGRALRRLSGTKALRVMR